VKVAIVHNLYDSNQSSGENSVVLNDVDQLTKLGQEVIFLNFGINSLKRSPISPYVIYENIKKIYKFRRNLRRIILKERPDLIHFHNLFPFIGFNVTKLASRNKIPLVFTMHNYRVTCINGSHFRNHSICIKCIRRSPFWGVIYRCYRGSFSQSFIAFFANRKLKKSLSFSSAVVTLSPFMTDHISNYLNSECMVLERATPSEKVNSVGFKKDKKVLFAGRLTEEKGVDLLCGSWTTSKAEANGWKLVIAGDGNEGPDLLKKFDLYESISFLGMLSADEIAHQMCSSAAVVVPSVWFEGFPKVISQACSNSCAVVVNNIGSLASLDLPGAIKIENNSQHWSDFFSKLDLKELSVMGLNNLEWWITNAESEIQSVKLLDFYKKVVQK
jgi:glycosyltransferase involved in cell wall biosynthesis